MAFRVIRGPTEALDSEGLPASEPPKPILSDPTAPSAQEEVDTYEQPENDALPAVLGISEQKSFGTIGTDLANRRWRLGPYIIDCRGRECHITFEGTGKERDLATKLTTTGSMALPFGDRAIVLIVYESTEDKDDHLAKTEGADTDDTGTSDSDSRGYSPGDIDRYGDAVSADRDRSTGKYSGSTGD